MIRSGPSFRCKYSRRRHPTPPPGTTPEHKTDHLHALPMGADPGKPLLQQRAALGKPVAVNA